MVRNRVSLDRTTTSPDGVKLCTALSTRSLAIAPSVFRAGCGTATMIMSSWKLKNGAVGCYAGCWRHS